MLPSACAMFRSRTSLSKFGGGCAGGGAFLKQSNLFTVIRQTYTKVEVNMTFKIRYSTCTFEWRQATKKN